MEAGHSVFVESTAGLGAGFSDEEYESSGAKITSSAWKHKMVVKVKVQATDPIKENQILMAYLHIEKGQNPDLLKKLLEKRVVSYAFEEIRDNNGKRLVNLGHEAGIVGMYEGLRLCGLLLEGNGRRNPFNSLPEMRGIGNERALDYLLGLDLKDDISVIIMGAGNVSRGAQETLNKAGIKPQVLGRGKTPYIENYLSGVDILVNAVKWYPWESHIITRKMLKLMKKTALILDISCDKNGAVETCTPTGWPDPTYKIEGISHFCVDNLPTAIPRKASIHLSSMAVPFVLKVANGLELESGLMTKNGVFEFKAKTKK